HLYWMWHALDRHWPERLHSNVAFGKPQGIGREADRAGRGELLHARRKMCGLADSRVIHLQIAADGAHHYSARIEPDADLYLKAMAVAQLASKSADCLLHAQCRVTGTHRVILMGNRRAEKSHDAVAHHQVHGALVVMHRLHHALEHRLKDGTRLLRIAFGDQL